jgi:RIO-like serine/threonine protein kinase
MFLVHLTENGRVMGILLEKVEGTFASYSDLPACQNLIRRVHQMGILDGDVNRDNFVVGQGKGQIWLVDWECAKNITEEDAKRAMEPLEGQVGEETDVLSTL